MPDVAASRKRQIEDAQKSGDRSAPMGLAAGISARPSRTGRRAKPNAPHAAIDDVLTAPASQLGALGPARIGILLSWGRAHGPGRGAPAASLRAPRRALSSRDSVTAPFRSWRIRADARQRWGAQPRSICARDRIETTFFRKRLTKTKAC